MTSHLLFPIDETSRIGEARRAVIQLAESLEFNEIICGRLALVVTELGSNLIKHAVNGKLLIASRVIDGDVAVEIISIDAGPGIIDVENCLRDGYSTAGTPGNGLGAIRRLADNFDLYTQIPHGTIVLARIFKNGNRLSDAQRQNFIIGAVSIAAPGEIVCGDSWNVAVEGNHAAVIVADGLGHGPAAADAAVSAINVFQHSPFIGPAEILEKAHIALRSTRGAAVGIYNIDAEKKQIHFTGAGNIIGRLISGIGDKTLMTQHGTVGVQMRSLQTQQIEWPHHTLLILHSDGIVARWNLSEYTGLLKRDSTIIAALIFRDYCRGRDDATVVVLRSEV